MAIRRVSLPERSAEINFLRQRIGPASAQEFERDCRNSSGGKEAALDGDLTERERIERLERNMLAIDGKLNDLLGIVKQQQAVLNALPQK
jgi:hypothetical protein